MRRLAARARVSRAASHCPSRTSSSNRLDTAQRGFGLSATARSARRSAVARSPSCNAWLSRPRRPEKLGLGAIQHRGEKSFCRGLVATKLRRLRRKQQGQEEARRVALRLCGHSAAPLPGRRRQPRPSLGSAPDTRRAAAVRAGVAYTRAGCPGSADNSHNSNITTPAAKTAAATKTPTEVSICQPLPDDRDPARIVGEENRRRDESRDHHERADGAHQEGVCEVVGGGAGSAPGAAGGWVEAASRRAANSSCRWTSAASAASRSRAMCSHGCAAPAFDPLSESSAETAVGRSSGGERRLSGADRRCLIVVRSATNALDGDQSPDPVERLFHHFNFPEGLSA